LVARWSCSVRYTGDAMLIDSSRPSDADIVAWQRAVRGFEANGLLQSHINRVFNAEHALRSFGDSDCYCGVSWGKDSVVVADMVSRIMPNVPLVWVRVSPIENPDCFLVRDSFLSEHSIVNYNEIVLTYSKSDDVGTGRLADGFNQARAMFGRRYISGVRGDESAARGKRVARWGENTANTCAPLARWSGDDVFAYLVNGKLPIAPAYACTMNGLLDPRKIRIATLGGERGNGHGRAAWEWRYYEREMRELFPDDGRTR